MGSGICFFLLVFFSFSFCFFFIDLNLYYSMLLLTSGRLIIGRVAINSEVDHYGALKPRYFMRNIESRRQLGNTEKMVKELLTVVNSRQPFLNEWKHSCSMFHYLRSNKVLGRGAESNSHMFLIYIFSKTSRPPCNDSRAFITVCFSQSEV